MRSSTAGTARAATAQDLAVVLAAIWLGMVIGVSFIATPVKFTAPMLDLAPALDVGRVTFALFSRVEWLLAGLIAILAVLSSPRRRPGVLVATLLIIIVVQSVWLLPVLDQRVEAVLDGRPMEPSWHHMAYAGLEAVKTLTLVAIIWSGLRRRATLDRHRPQGR